MVADNDALESLYQYVGERAPGHLLSGFANTTYNFKKFWDEDKQEFASRVPDTGELLTDQTGAEKYLALLGRTAMDEVQVELVLGSLDGATVSTEYPVATGKNSGKIQDGAMSPMINALIFFALDSDSEREAVLRVRISNAIVDAWHHSTSDDKPEKSFTEAVDSSTGEPIGAEHWGPSAAAAVSVTSEMLKAQQASVEANR